eukprot:Rhum_TRINITY_DN11411_c2_g1::Rhum_TRINITY_DN11411_c2_g1_i1::g.44607::m.44607
MCVLSRGKRKVREFWGAGKVFQDTIRNKFLPVGGYRRSCFPHEAAGRRSHARPSRALRPDGADGDAPGVRKNVVPRVVPLDPVKHVLLAVAGTRGHNGVSAVQEECLRIRSPVAHAQARVQAPGRRLHRPRPGTRRHGARRQQVSLAGSQRGAGEGSPGLRPLAVDTQLSLAADATPCDAQRAFTAWRRHPHAVFEPGQLRARGGAGRASRLCERLDRHAEPWLGRRGCGVSSARLGRRERRFRRVVRRHAQLDVVRVGKQLLRQGRGLLVGPGGDEERVANDAAAAAVARPHRTLLLHEAQRADAHACLLLDACKQPGDGAQDEVEVASIQREDVAEGLRVHGRRAPDVCQHRNLSEHLALAQHRLHLVCGVPHVARAAHDEEHLVALLADVHDVVVRRVDTHLETLLQRVHEHRVAANLSEDGQSRNHVVARHQIHRHTELRRQVAKEILLDVELPRGVEYMLVIRDRFSYKVPWEVVTRPQNLLHLADVRLELAFVVVDAETQCDDGQDRGVHEHTHDHHEEREHGHPVLAGEEPAA